jgi:hypothetical protein
MAHRAPDRGQAGSWLPLLALGHLWFFDRIAASLCSRSQFCLRFLLGFKGLEVGVLSVEEADAVA